MVPGLLEKTDHNGLADFFNEIRQKLTLAHLSKSGMGFARGRGGRPFPVFTSYVSG